MMNSKEIRYLRHVMTAVAGLVLLPALAHAVVFDPRAVDSQRAAAGVSPTIECDPVAGPAQSQTYRHTKKVKAFKENQASRQAVKPPVATTANKPKPKPKPKAGPTPVTRRAPPKESTVLQRIHQNCHQVVPPGDFTLAGLPPMEGDLLEEPVPTHATQTALNIDGPGTGPCVGPHCGYLPNTPGGDGSSSSGGGSSGGSSGGGSSGGGSSGGSSGASSSGGSSSGGSSGASSSGASSSGASSSGASSSGASSSGASSSGASSSGASSSGASSSGASSSGASSSGASSSGASSSGASSSGASSSGASGSGSGSGGSGSSSGGVQVPEPGVTLLMLLGLTGLVSRRRGRH